MSPDTIPRPPRNPLCIALDNLLKFTREDFGEGFEAALILDLMLAAQAQPTKAFEDIIDGVALDWSK